MEAAFSLQCSNSVLLFTLESRNPEGGSLSFSMGFLFWQKAVRAFPQKLAPKNCLWRFQPKVSCDAFQYFHLLLQWHTCCYINVSCMHLQPALEKVS